MKLWVLVRNISSIISLSMVFIPLIPLPPLFCTLKVSFGILLIYPSFVMEITISSLLISSSSVISSEYAVMDVLLSSPYLSAIAASSVLITPRSLFSSASISLYSAIFAISSLYSFSIFSLSRPVRARSLISTIAPACASESPNLSISFALASPTFFEFLMIVMTSSMLSSAMR